MKQHKKSSSSPLFPQRSLVMMALSLLGVLGTTAYFIATSQRMHHQQTVQSTHYHCQSCGTRSAINNPQSSLTSQSVTTSENFTPVIVSLHRGTYRSHIETPRLLLREVTLADVDGIYRYKSDPETAQSAAWEIHTDKKETEHEIKKMMRHYRTGENAHWGIVIKATNQIIGFGGFTMMSPLNNRATAGWWIGSEHWGKGYGTEVARAVIEYGFAHLKLNRIDAVARVYNAASGRVLEKAGMYRIATHRDYWNIRNELSSWHEFALLRRDVTEQLSGSILTQGKARS